jgi:two-component system chemotaxis sensor kinase CheA
MSEDASLLEEFLAESAEHLTRTETDLTTLERDGEDEDGELVRRIFRAVHTIKGSSGFFGYVRIGSVAHAMESLLDRLREGQVKPTKELIGVLFEGLDQLSALFSDIEDSNDVDTSALEDRIRAFLPGKKEAPKPCGSVQRNQAAETAVPPGILEELCCGHHLYRLSYDLRQMEKEHQIGPMALVERLASFGTIHDGTLEPTGQNLREGIPEGVRYRLYFSSVLEKEFIADAVLLPPELVEEVAYAAPDTSFLTGAAPAGAGRAAAGTPASPTPTVTAEVTSRPDSQADSRSDSHADASCPGEAREGSSEAPRSEERHETEYLKVRLEILDKLMALAGELVLVRNQQLMIADPDDSEERGITQRLDIVTSDLQETIMRTRMQPIGGVFSRFGRVVRDLGRKLGKEIEIEAVGSDVEIDKNILEALIDPLTHIVRNSCDHGIEAPEERERMGKPRTGTLTLRAYHEGGQINVEIQDDGAGVDREAIRRKVLEKGLKTEAELRSLTDPELLGLIFLPGFSTNDQVTDVSGRGVGMDVVKSNVENLGGVVEVQSNDGEGTCVKLRLPLTLAIIPSMIVETCGQRFAIPQINLEELVTLYDEDVVGRIECAGSREVFRLRDTLLSLVHLQEVLERSEPFTEEARREATERHRKARQSRHAEFQASRIAGKPCDWQLGFAVLKIGGERFGLVIDRIVGTEEIVVKPMHRVLKDLPIYSGATVLGDGHVALILDVQGIARHSGVQMDELQEADEKEVVLNGADERKRLLLFRNQPDEQLALPLEQVSRIEHIEMKDVERIGERDYITIHGTSIRLLQLDHYLDLSPTPKKAEMYAIIPKTSQKPYCILVPELVDIGEFAFQMSTDNYCHAGVEGTGLLDGKLTVVIEPEAIARMAEPQWYREAA